MHWKSIFAATLLATALPAAAQNSSAEPPAVTPPPPPTTPAAPPATAGTPPATATTPPPAQVEPAPVVVVPQTQAPAPAPVTISPDAAYPNGFADPANPFGNEMGFQQRQDSGFPWGLLGLLGLLGLIPLFRRGDRLVRTVYVDRDEPKRVIREERIED